MKHTLLVSLAAACTLLLGIYPSAFGAEFSADMVQLVGGVTRTGRYYMGNQKMRTETTNDKGVMVATIIDVNAKKMFQLNPSEKMYMEMPMGGDLGSWAGDEKTVNEYYEKKHVGSETVNGYACDKYELMPKKQGLGKSTTWIAKKLGFPIKTTGTNYSMELKNIRTGSQPDELFAVPDGYEKVSMPDSGSVVPRSSRRAAPEMDEEKKEDTDSENQREPSKAEEDVKEIGEDAHQEVKDTIKDEVSDSIRKGIRSIFGRD
jgi:hypothetical protein